MLPHCAPCVCSLTVSSAALTVDDRIYVLKQINISVLSAKEQRECIGEVQLLASVDSPYVVRYYDSFIELGALNIIMEFCAKGDLHQRLRVSCTGKGGRGEARCYRCWRKNTREELSR